MSSRPARDDDARDRWSGAARAGLAVAGLDAEVAAWPKPGPASRTDPVSRAGTSRRSADALRPWLAALEHA